METYDSERDIRVAKVKKLKSKLITDIEDVLKMYKQKNNI